MIPQFLNREEELRFLEKIHGEEGFKLVWGTEALFTAGM